MSSKRSLLIRAIRAVIIPRTPAAPPTLAAAYLGGDQLPFAWGELGGKRHRSCIIPSFQRAYWEACACATGGPSQLSSGILHVCLPRVHRASNGKKEPMARWRVACLVLVSNVDGHPPPERQHCLSLRVTYWSAPLPAMRCCPALVENSFPGAWNRWYLWCLSVVLTWRAGEGRICLRFHDSSPSLLVTAALLRLTCVTLASPCARDRSAPYFCSPLPCARGEAHARHALTACDSARAGLGARRREPRPGLSVKPTIPCSRNRCTHL